MAILKFYDTEENFRKFHLTLKLRQCPHCRRYGTLNLHGYLRGYAEHDSNERIIRGRRIFCSNRHSRQGCGKTCSVLRCGYLKRFILSLQTLWLFLNSVAAGQRKLPAFTAVTTDQHPSAAYRIFTRFMRAQSYIRARLLRHTALPSPPDSPHPLSSTIKHLRMAFPFSSCPLSDFQLTFQTPLL